MGWKGTLRSIRAASNASARQSAKNHRAAMKAQVINNAARAVINFRSYLYRITSHHKCRFNKVDWNIQEKLPRPSKPIREDFNTALSISTKLENYKPNWLVKIFNLQELHKSFLERRIINLKAVDEEYFKEKLQEYNLSLTEWKKKTSLAKRVLLGEVSAYEEALTEYRFLEGIENLKFSDIDKKITFENERLVLNILLPDKSQIVPKTKLKQNPSGTLKESEMPIREGNKIYQDFVASVSLRTGAELLAIIPEDLIEVNCYIKKVNTRTGHLERVLILSVIYLPQTFEDLKLEKVDASDALANFPHSMKFTSTKGFEEVAGVSLERA